MINNSKSDIKIQKAHSTLLLFGMFSMVMLFAGLTSAYIVHKNSLIPYSLGFCSLQDSTLIMHSKFENEPIDSGYFVYKTDQFGDERVLLGVVDLVDSKSQNFTLEEISDSKTSEYRVENVIKLKQFKSSTINFKNEMCFATKWDYISLPHMFYLSTVIIILSSLFGWLVIRYCKLNNFKLARVFLLVTLALGLLFAVCQFLGWNDLITTFRYIGGDNNVASSYLYILTGTHFAHLIGGIISLLYIYFKSLFNKYNIDNFHGIILGVRFWHFLGLLWLYLFLFLLIIN